MITSSFLSLYIWSSIDNCLVVFIMNWSLTINPKSHCHKFIELLFNRSIIGTENILNARDRPLTLCSSYNWCYSYLIARAIVIILWIVYSCCWKILGFVLQLTWNVRKPYHCYHQFLVIFSQLCFVYFLVRCKLTDLVMVINSTIAEDQKDPGREDCTAKFSHWRRFFWASNRRCSQWSNTWWNPSFNLEAKLRTEVCWYLLQYE